MRRPLALGSCGSFENAGVEANLTAVLILRRTQLSVGLEVKDCPPIPVSEGEIEHAFDE